MNKVVLAGGSGFLGQVLARAYAAEGWDVVVLTRGGPPPAAGRAVTWDGRTPGPWGAEIEGSAMVVNLSGKSVNCRYHAANRREILRSRVEPTRALAEAIGACAAPPPLWINGASATIYRHAEDRPMTERGGEIGSGFSVEVCQQWETAFNEARTPFTRKVALRAAMVLGHGANSVLPMLLRLTRLGLGGTMGPGTQFVSWLHEADFVGIVEWIRTHDGIQCPVNACAPVPVTNRELMRLLRRVCRRPLGLPATRWMLEAGAVFLRTETELVLKSRRVVPERLLASGYPFRFPTLAEALQDLCRRGDDRQSAASGFAAYGPPFPRERT